MCYGSLVSSFVVLKLFVGMKSPDSTEAFCRSD